MQWYVKWLITCAEKQPAANKQALFADNFGLTPVDSMSVVSEVERPCKITCCSGNPLELQLLSMYGKPAYGGE